MLREKIEFTNGTWWYPLSVPGQSQIWLRVCVDEHSLSEALLNFSEDIRNRKLDILEHARHFAEQSEYEEDIRSE